MGPGKCRSKDTNMLAASFSLYCEAPQTLALSELHIARCKAADQLGQSVAAHVNYTNLFCLSLSGLVSTSRSFWMQQLDLNLHCRWT